MNNQSSIQQRFRNFVSKHLAKFIGIIVIVVVIIFIIHVLLHYYEDWTGFGPRVTYQNFEPGRTLWDWLQLLIIPAILAGVAIYFTNSERRSEQKIARERDETARYIAADERHERELQSYFDRMTELLLEKDLLNTYEESEVRAVARARTLAVLFSLDAGRRLAVLRFLREISMRREKTQAQLDAVTEWDPSETFLFSMKGAFLPDFKPKGHFFSTYLSGLICNGIDIHEIELTSANLTRAKMTNCNLSNARLVGADLRQVVLYGCNLSGATLLNANAEDINLIGADLSNANLIGTNLTDAQLRRANLTGAQLMKANLSGASLDAEQLTQSRGLMGAIMPNGHKWQGNLDGPYTVEELEPYCHQNINT